MHKYVGPSMFTCVCLNDIYVHTCVYMCVYLCSYMCVCVISDNDISPWNVMLSVSNSSNPLRSLSFYLIGV